MGVREKLRAAAGRRRGGRVGYLPSWGQETTTPWPARMRRRARGLGFGGGGGGAEGNGARRGCRAGFWRAEARW